MSTATIERNDTIKAAAAAALNIPGLNVEATKTMSRIKAIDMVLRSQLEEYKTSKNVSLRQLAKELASSETMVSKYLANKFEGNVELFEAAVRDLLKSAALRNTIIVGEIETFPTLITKQVHKFIELHRRASSIGLIFGPSGIGKTRAIETYLATNKLALFFGASRFSGCNHTAVINAIFRQIDHASYVLKKHGTKGQYVAEKLRGSGRLLIVDDAHRLTRKAVECLFDFHHDTKCPVVLVGYEDAMLGFIRGIDCNGTLASKLGSKITVDLKNTVANVATEMVKRIWPEAVDQIAPLAIHVAEQPGHLRSLFNQLRLAKELHVSGVCQSAEQAFRGAHGYLIREYKLPVKTQPKLAA